jgi:alanyl-tRNA synthetase
LEITSKTLSVAIEEGAMALFGEKYGDTVRTITIKDGQKNISYELCGGTHVSDTGEIGLFLITSEGSAAAGIRRIEAVTGRSAYDYVKHKLTLLRNTANLLGSSQEEVQEKTVSTLEELDQARKLVSRLKQGIAATEFTQFLSKVPTIGDVPVLSAVLTNADADTLRQMADRFREKYPSGIVVLGSAVEGRPVIIAAVTEDLVNRGIHAGELVKTISQVVGGSGGGKPTLAQAGGKDATKLADAISLVKPFVEARLKK